MSGPPNILFIMTDDHAAHAMGCFGSRINRTPNLDRIAAEGARFERCFCSKPKEWELFDLVADPYELNSVYGRTEYADVQSALTEELARLQDLVGDEPVST